MGLTCEHLDRLFPKIVCVILARPEGLELLFGFFAALDGAVGELFKLGGKLNLFRDPVAFLGRELEVALCGIETRGTASHGQEVTRARAPRRMDRYRRVKKDK
jgi:hypothetical protein